MPRELQQLIERTIDASHLNASEKEELRRELNSHILAHIYELEVSGHSEAQIISKIKEEFGDTEEIGKQMFMVHRKFERIPWFGAFFYYQPLVSAFKLMYMHLLALAIYCIGTIFTPFIFLSPRFDSEFLFEKLVHMGGISLAICVGLVAGNKLRKRHPILNEAVEAIALSFVPYILIVGMILLSNELAASPATTVFHFYTKLWVFGTGLYILSIGIGLFWNNQSILQHIWKRKTD